MKKFTPFKTSNHDSAKEITWEQAKLIGLPIVDAKCGVAELHGELKTFGMWQIPVSYKALATTQSFDTEENDVTRKDYTMTVFGPRTLTDIQQSGYELEGRVSIGGKRYRGFTSSQLFKLPDGHLVNVAIIHVCMDQPK